MASGGISSVDAQPPPRPPQVPHQKRRYFSSVRQPNPATKKRPAMSTEFIVHPTERRKKYSRTLGTIERTIKLLQSATGAEIVCLAQYDAGSTKDSSIRAVGGHDTNLMRAVYSDPRAGRVRRMVLKEACSPEPGATEALVVANRSAAAAPRPASARGESQQGELLAVLVSRGACGVDDS
jgi:hypothetical protein